MRSASPTTTATTILVALAACVTPALTQARARRVTPHRQCPDRATYVVRSHTGLVLDRLSGVETIYNRSPHPRSVTFTLPPKPLGRARIETSGHGRFAAAAIISGSTRSAPDPLRRSIAVTGSPASMSIRIPAHAYGHGAYGDWRWVTGGAYETYGASCRMTSMTRIRASVPTVAEGWTTWISH